MCGIVGHIGPSNSVDVVLEGLKRLEYRGYDSAGICFKEENGNLALFKKVGKLDNLRALLGTAAHVSHSCIGHTRWATHGGVTDINAHPHVSDSIAVDDERSVAIVHNGIIENASALKDQIEMQGLKFKTETDSEVFLALLVLELRCGKCLRESIQDAFKKVEGNSAFVIQMKGVREIFAVKRGAPLVCGINKKNFEVFASSDPYALAGFADKIYFPEDSVICSLSPDRDALLQFFELDGTPSHRFISQAQSLAVEISDKGEFEHYMLKEIYEQPDLIRSLARYYSSGVGMAHLQNATKTRPSRIHLSACGTAWHAGLLIRNFLEQNNRIPCSIELASEFRYKDPLLEKGEMGIFISQSGETADTLAAQRLCKENGLTTYGIVNVEGSTLFRACDDNFLIRAGQEIGVASTKAFTQQVLLGRLLSYGYSGNFENTFSLMAEKFGLLADRIDGLLKDVGLLKFIAGKIYNQNGFIYTGRGAYYPVALEGALKLKEIAYVHAEGYAAGELKHGPIALIDEKIVNIAFVGKELYDKTVSNIQEVRARRGIIVTIGPEGDSALEKISDYYIPMKFNGLDEFAPLYVNVVCQLLAYFVAKEKGTDIDKPRNLAKSVTVE